jgi:hypothetical protein
MGANAQTSVPDFTAGQVLTAAQMTEVNTGIPVFADSSARDAAFGGTGEKVLAEGQFAFLEDTNATQVYDGSTWQSVGVSPGLVLIKTQVIGTTVGSVTVTDAFSATYDNYKIVVTGGVASTQNSLRFTLGATVTGYYYGGFYYDYGANSGGYARGSNAAGFDIGAGTTNKLFANAEIFDPFLADQTTFTTSHASALTTAFMQFANGFLDNTTSYTAFTLTATGGTFTGGTIRVYGYANS